MFPPISLRSPLKGDWHINLGQQGPVRCGQKSPGHDSWWHQPPSGHLPLHSRIFKRCRIHQRLQSRLVLAGEGPTADTVHPRLPATEPQWACPSRNGGSPISPIRFGSNNVYTVTLRRVRFGLWEWVCFIVCMSHDIDLWGNTWQFGMVEACNAGQLSFALFIIRHVKLDSK